VRRVVIWHLPNPITIIIAVRSPSFGVRHFNNFFHLRHLSFTTSPANGGLYLRRAFMICPIMTPQARRQVQAMLGVVQIHHTTLLRQLLGMSTLRYQYHLLLQTDAGHNACNSQWQNLYKDIRKTYNLRMT